MSDDGKLDPVLGDCDDSGAVGRLAAAGFVALWRGERVQVGQLCADQAIVDTQLRAGRLELDDTGFVVGVHGLTVRPTRHRIEHGDTLVHTWCALDAIGIPAALAIDATAVTSCPTCDARLEVKLAGGEPVDTIDAWRLWLPEGRCDHLVEDFCHHANLYCSADHLTIHPGADAVGRALSVAEVVAIGRATWADAASALSNRETTP